MVFFFFCIRLILADERRQQPSAPKSQKWILIAVVYVVSRRTTKLTLRKFVSSGKMYLANVLVKFLKFLPRRFPSSELPLYNVWVQIIQNQMNNPLFVPNKNSIVCTNHFEEHCFNRSQRRLSLRKGSKPTIFRNVSETAYQQVFEIKM